MMNNESTVSIYVKSFACYKIKIGFRYELYFDPYDENKGEGILGPDIICKKYYIKGEIEILAIL